MKTKTLLIFFAAFLVFLSCEEKNDENSLVNYGYESWPGKKNPEKTDIAFPGQLVHQFKLELTAGSTGASFFFKVPLAENDDLKKGRLQVEVYDSVEKAQLGLIEYLDLLTNPSKPPRLSGKNEVFGDVAFGDIFDGIYKLEFVRNNVLVVVYAPTETARTIATGIDEAIETAPLWQGGSKSPSFILP